MVKMNTKKGFTLIELIIVVAILAVLAAIAIPSVAGLIDRANISSDNSNAKEMTNAIERFVSEYELAKQDIYAGTFITGDLDSAQGRVHNAVGIQTVNDIAALEKDNYGFSTLAISRKTKYPINEKTVKQIIMNYCKTSSTIFQPKQSDKAYYYSPELGIVVVAPAGATKMELMDIAIAEGAQSIDNTEWINLTINAERDESNWVSKVWATSSKNQYTEMEEVSSSRPTPDVEYDDNVHHNGSGGNKPSGGNNGGTGNNGGNNGNGGGTTSCTHTDTRADGKKDATCTEDGYTGDIICNTCSATISTGTVIAKTGHQNTRTEGATPTFSGDIYCSDCNAKISDGKPIGHEGGVIPAGATYKSNCLNYCSSCFAVLTEPSTNTSPEYCHVCGEQAPNVAYWNQGVTYSAGQEFPVAKPGDIYTFGEYTYMLDCDMDMYHYWTYTNADNGWGVVVNNAEQTSYSPALTMVNNQYITSMSGTYAQCEFLTTVPELPYTTQKMVATFAGCRELNSIDRNYLSDLTFLNDISYAFNGCDNLTNSFDKALIIPNSVTNYANTFSDTDKDIYICGLDNNKSNNVLATIITQGNNVALSVYKNDIIFDNTSGNSEGYSFTYEELVNSSISKYSFVPVKDGTYTFASKYGYEGSGNYLYTDTYSYYKLCNCYSSIYEWCPDYFDCDHGYEEFYGEANNFTSYDAYGYLVDKSNNTIKESDDDSGNGYENTEYRGNNSDFYKETLESMGCPNVGKSLYKYEKCPTCQVYRQYNAYCELYNDSQSSYNFGFGSNLTNGNEYDVYLTCYYEDYDDIYTDYLIIRYFDDYDE